MLRSAVPGEYVSVHMHRNVKWDTNRVFRQSLYSIVFCEGFAYDSLELSEKMLIEYALADGGRIVQLSKV
jgi:hypothetical protein